MIRWLLGSVSRVPHAVYVPAVWFRNQTAPSGLNIGALLARWNFAFNLARSDEGWYGGVSFNRDLFAPEASTVGEWVDAAAQQILAAPLAGPDRDALIEFVSDGAGEDFEIWGEWREWKTSSLVGLLLRHVFSLI